MAETARSSQSSSTAPKGKISSYVVVHRLRCDNKQRYHTKHASTTNFRDPPQLLKGANRASQPRGRHVIKNVDTLIEEHQELAFAVYIDYSCNIYHERNKDMFIYQNMPQMEEELAMHVKPYFYTLPEDAPVALAEAESIFPSRNLETAMEQVASFDPDTFQHWSAAHNLAFPYLHLYHSKEILANIGGVNLGIDGGYYLEALSEYISLRMVDEFEDAEALFEQGKVNRRHWAKLFRPGDTIVRWENGHPMAYVTTLCPRPSKDMLNLQCWSWEFDSRFWKKSVLINVVWPSKDEEIAITDLSVFPLRFDKTNLEQRLRDRGTTIWSCRRRRFVGYDTPAQAAELQNVNFRYMVDMATWQLMHGADEDSQPREELDEQTLSKLEPPTGVFLLLLPALIKGFGFHDKKWKMLQAENIQEIVWNKDVFNYRLVLDEKKKRLIRALVTVHVQRRHIKRTDFLEGKGEGLIMLLHGGPGTGKTLTAESVAEIAERPLYRVTCGDIGTDAESVERYLKAVLDIGTRWGSVVLLDEADVFLEERSKMDLQRNALVSVFLRVLEYYDGILILTTNRIGLFDEAFKSRINLSLHYPKLDVSSRESVWRNFGKSLAARDEIDERDIKEHIDDLAKHDLNGRQIRNVINIARDLAVFDNKKLAYEFIHAALEPVMEFEHFIADVRPLDDEDHAREMGLR